MKTVHLGAFYLINTVQPLHIYNYIYICCFIPTTYQNIKLGALVVNLNQWEKLSLVWIMVVGLVLVGVAFSCKE